MERGGAGEDTARPRDALKSALLDQKNIAGLGIFMSAKRFTAPDFSPLRIAGVSPLGKALKALERLFDSIKAVLTEAIEAGGSSLRTTTDRWFFAISNIISGLRSEKAPCPRPAARVSSRRDASGPVRRSTTSRL